MRKKFFGVLERPRVSVFRSSRHIYAQIIDDTSGRTLLSESDIKLNNGAKTEKAFRVGESLARKSIAKNIKKVVFDKGGSKYHGRVASLAEGLRKGGLEF